MISIVIIGILAAVASSAYYKYILAARAAEAPLSIKTLYDAEVIFANKASFTIQDEGNIVSCKPDQKFLAMCMKKLDDAETGTTNRLPGSRKAKVAYYHTKLAPTYSVATNTCSFHTANANPRFLGIEEDLEVESSNNATLGFSIVKEPRYFLTRSRRDDLIAAEYGVDINDTLLVYAIGDLDGDHSVIDEPIPCSGSSIRNPSDHFAYKNISVYARSLHIDAEGDIQGSAGLIKINPFE